MTFSRLTKRFNKIFNNYNEFYIILLFFHVIFIKIQEQLLFVVHIIDAKRTMLSVGCLIKTKTNRDVMISRNKVAEDAMRCSY